MYYFAQITVARLSFGHGNKLYLEVHIQMETLAIFYVHD